MNFVSVTFLAFFVTVFAAYWALPDRWRVPLLLVASYGFYAAWDWRFPSLMVAVTLLDFYAGARIDASTRLSTRRAWLGLSVAGNLGILAYFKYMNFFLDNLVRFANAAGWQLSQPTLHIILPVGISFYCFHTLSYPLDIYFQKFKPIRSLLQFATFVAFFPQLVAGPITRARDFLYQLAEPKQWHPEEFQEGLIRFINGFVKKAFIADVLALNLVDPVFRDPGRYADGTLWLALAGYSVQIYADFSGYSSMAVGTARMLGYRLPENFRFPYLSSGFSEFWRRWHITMSTFFRDYVYVPLGGNRKGRGRTLINLGATTFLSGLWHGANWTFVAWGLLHGVFITASHMLRDWSKDATPSRIRSLAGWTLTTTLVCLAWIPFRAPNFETAWLYFRHLTGTPGERIVVSGLIAAAFAAFVVDHVFGWMSEHRERWLRAIPAPAWGVGYAALVILLLHAVPRQPAPFIYFQF